MQWKKLADKIARRIVQLNTLAILRQEKEFKSLYYYYLKNHIQTKKKMKKICSCSIDKCYSSLHHSSGKSLSKDEIIISKEIVPVHDASCRMYLYFLWAFISFWFNKKNLTFLHLILKAEEVI